MMATARSLVCGFCGRRFTEDRGQPACGACPLRAGCRWVRCPHCGYENPLPPRWLERVTGWLARPRANGRGHPDRRGFLAKGAAPSGNLLSRVADLAEGAAGRVVWLDRATSSATAQLVALGIYPGVTVQLVQRFPAFVLQVGLAEVALDRQMAERIWVKQLLEGGLAG